MHEPSTFSAQLAEYRAMPKLTKLMHRTLFWIDRVQLYRKKARENYRISETSVYPARRTEVWIIAERYNTAYNFCIFRYKAAKTDLKNYLIELEELNKIIA